MSFGIPIRERLDTIEVRLIPAGVIPEDAEYGIHDIGRPGHTRRIAREINGEWITERFELSKEDYRIYRGHILPRKDSVRDFWINFVGRYGSPIEREDGTFLVENVQAKKVQKQAREMVHRSSIPKHRIPKSVRR